MSFGGGTRLLSNLLPAIARQDDMELIRLVVSSQMQAIAPFNELGHAYANIEIAYFDGDIQSPEGTSFYHDCHVVYYFWPHQMKFKPINRPTICTYHDTTILDFVPPFTTGTYIRNYWESSKEWLEHTTSVIVSSNYVRERIISHFGSHCQATVIPYAIAPNDVSSGSIRPEIAAKLPPDYIVYPANTSPHKNHYNLLLAYSRFSQRKQLPLVLFGYHTDLLICEPPNWPDVPSIATLVSLIRRTGLRVGEDFYALGYLSDQDIMPVIRGAKALIMPTLSEGGGLPVFEALRLKVPVLCSDIPVMREHLDHWNITEKVAWFDPESPDSIAGALEQFVADYDHYKAIADQAVLHAENWDDLARKYIHVFRRSYLKYYGQM
jgi:glycosyltransferase involved in cell wall biosynthesis